MLRPVKKIVTTENFAIVVSRDHAIHTALTDMQQVIQRKKICGLRVAYVHAMELEMYNKNMVKSVR